MQKDDWKWLDEQPDFQKTPPDAHTDKFWDDIDASNQPCYEYMQHRPEKYEYSTEDAEALAYWYAGLILCLASAAAVFFVIQRWVWPWLFS